MHETQQFRRLLKDRFAKELFEGWTVERFEALTKCAQAFLLEFIRDSSGSERPNKDSFAIVTEEMRKEAWRTRRQFYRTEKHARKFVEYVEGFRYDKDDSNPATILMIKDLAATPKTKKR